MAASSELIKEKIGDIVDAFFDGEISRGALAHFFLSLGEYIGTMPDQVNQGDQVDQGDQGGHE